MYYICICEFMYTVFYFVPWKGVSIVTNDWLAGAWIQQFAVDRHKVQ